MGRVPFGLRRCLDLVTLVSGAFGRPVALWCRIEYVSSRYLVSYITQPCEGDDTFPDWPGKVSSLGFTEKPVVIRLLVTGSQLSALPWFGSKASEFFTIISIMMTAREHLISKSRGDSSRQRFGRTTDKTSISAIRRRQRTGSETW